MKTIEITVRVNESKESAKAKLIKNGFVQWNGRSDIPCTYAEMEDGTKYYFKQELQNGNHIVTTSLLEAIIIPCQASNGISLNK